MQPPLLCIRLLGAVDLRYGDRSLPLPSARAESLLAYLLLHRDAPQPRQRLAFLLWPDSTEEQARTNLRHVLHDLRRALPDADRFLDVAPRTLRWRPDAPFWLDVAAFEAALTRAAASDEDDALPALREAVELFRGDLLDGSYDDWVLAERERMRSRYLAALERLAVLLGDRGDHAQAIVYAERLLQHDPLHEEACRLLMRLYHASGQQARALQIYHHCSATLERELGVAPSTAMRDAYAALFPHEVDRATPRAVPDATAGGGSTLVGRASEWRRLTAVWDDVERRRARFVLVSGEPGVGKTRLVEEFRSWAARRGAVVAVARSYASEGAMVFGSLVAWLRSAAFRSRLDRLDRAARADLAPLLPDLLPSPAADAPLPEAPGTAQRQRLFDAAVRALLAAGEPILLVADDIQWCDPDTLQFLHYLLRSAPDAPLLVAATARREEIDRGSPANALFAGLHALDRITEIELGRLGRDDTVMLATQLAGRPLGDLAGDRLFRETEGNPLFVVEAIRSGWSDTADPAGISPKVQAVIEDRLAQVSESARDLVGLAATLGREFTPDVLALASGAGGGALVRDLDELWRRRIVREHGGAYDFSHDKIREVAYLALGPARRRFYHLRAASALETLHAHDPASVSSQLAMHYERAGAVDQAIAWSVRAADAAQRVYADAEAARLLNRARDLLLTLPETPARGSREMAILAALSASLGTAEGFASARLADVHRRAQTLAADLGVELPPPLLRSLAVASLAGSDFPAAQGFGRQLRARGEREADGVLLVESEYVLGIAAFWQGQFVSAREHFETAIARYRPEERRAHLLQFGLDPKVVCLSRLGNTLWFLGHVEAAAEARDAALSLAEEIAHPYSKEVSLVFAAHLALDMRDEVGVRTYTAQLTAALGDHSWRPTLVSGAILAAFVEVLDGRAAEGIARIRQILSETHGAEHAPGMQAASARVLLEACAVAGDARVGLNVSKRALAMKASLWEPDVRRLRAEFLAALDAPREEIEGELARALETARRQQARSLELRVAASLVRLRQRRGDSPALHAAHAALRAILAAMPEGLDTRDVQEAASLLG